MVSVKRQSIAKKAQINALNGSIIFYSDFARQLQRSTFTITRFFCRRKAQNQQKTRARNQKLSNRVQRQIVFAALREKKSPGDIRDSLDLEISVRRVQRLLKLTPFLRYRRPERAPHLTRWHREERPTWAKKNLDWDHPDWRHVIFSEKMKFNLDGSDGLCSCWSDLWKELEILSVRQPGGWSSMVWAATSYHGRLSIVGIERNMDSKYYCDVLEEALISKVSEVYGDVWTLDQDNATVHSPELTK